MCCWVAGGEGALCGRIAVSEGQWFLWGCDIMGCMWVGGGFMMCFWSFYGFWCFWGFVRKFTGLNPCCGIVSDLVGFWSFLGGVVFFKDACDNNLWVAIFSQPPCSLAQPACRVKASWYVQKLASWYVASSTVIISLNFMLLFLSTLVQESNFLCKKSDAQRKFSLFMAVEIRLPGKDGEETGDNWGDYIWDDETTISSSSSTQSRRIATRTANSVKCGCKSSSEVGRAFFTGQASCCSTPHLSSISGDVWGCLAHKGKIFLVQFP